MSRMEMWGVEGIGEVHPGDVLADLITDAISAMAARDPSTAVRDGDVLVVTQKIVSKAEGRVVAIDPDDPLSHKQLVEEEAVRVVRRRGDLIVTETKHGFVCANAGIDLSNMERGWAALLPLDSDRSARRIRDGAARPHRMSRSASSSPTRSDAPGGEVSPTSRSAAPALPACSTYAARPTLSAERCR